MKLNEMIANGDITEDQAKMGYVGAYTYAEVMSGYTSFFLGARSVCPSATMDVPLPVPGTMRPLRRKQLTS